MFIFDKFKLLLFILAHKNQKQKSKKKNLSRFSFKIFLKSNFNHYFVVNCFKIKIEIFYDNLLLFFFHFHLPEICNHQNFPEKKILFFYIFLLPSKILHPFYFSCQKLAHTRTQKEIFTNQTFFHSAQFSFLFFFFSINFWIVFINWFLSIFILFSLSYSILIIK